MNSIKKYFTYFFGTFSLYNFLLLSFGLPFLTEGLFLFFRQSFLNNLYSPFYLLLFVALIFLYGSLYSQIQSNETDFQNFSLKSAFTSFGFWLILSPIFFFRFYQMMLVWQPLPAKVLSFLFLYRWKILPVIGIFYLILLYLLYRSILAPKYLKENHSLKKSVWLSWQKTRYSFPKQILLFFVIPIFFLATSFLIKIGFIWATKLIARQVSAMFLLLLYRVLQNVLWTFFFLYLASPDKGPLAGESRTKGAVIWLSLTIFSCLGLYSLHYAHAFHIQQQTPALTISHRGVSNHNGVQNSIEVLKRTSYERRPDFVEMDVQETADHHLVVMHDEDLKALANKNKRVDESTWQELKDITLKENGYTSTIPLFTDYLATANQLNQKLLIELKVTAKTKESIVHQMIPLKKDLARHELQSMNLDTANQMKKEFPKLKVGYILPFDLLGSPKNTLDFVNIESRTANSDLIQALRHQKQGVYVWSVNTKQQASMFRFQQVNGFLSDDLTVFSGSSDDIKAQTASILWFD